MNLLILLQREHPEFLSGIGDWYRKVDGVQKLQYLSETRQDRTKVTAED